MDSSSSSTLGTIWNCRRPILAVTIPFLLLPWPILKQSEETACAYVVSVMALFWLLEVVPLAITALLPVFMFPVVGVMSTKAVCNEYMKETVMIFLGSLMAATAVEHCNLHQRIALRVLRIVGSSPRWLLLGFMVTTTVLSMWISNSATTALMVPIVDAVLKQLTDSGTERKDTIGSIHSADFERRRDSGIYRQNSLPVPLSTRGSISHRSSVAYPYEEDDTTKFMRKALFLGVCYSANVGGTGTLTGTTPNLILKGQIESDYPDYHDLTFSSWMMFNFPGALLCMLAAWVFLQVVYLRKCPSNKDREKACNQLILDKYESLGEMSFHEKAVGLLFVLMVFMFFFREPEFIPGWASFRPQGYIQDGATAIFIVVLMFIIPADPNNFSTSPALLEWNVVHEKVGWGLALLLGGGFAIAEGAKQSGLSKWLAESLSLVEFGTILNLQLAVSVIALLLTEVTSNTATSTILLPVIGKMAELKNVHPITLQMPVCISCSYAFMLPIATGPNAIVFDAAKFTPIDMAIPGIVMKFICLAVIIIMINTLGYPIFELDTLLVKHVNNMTSVDGYNNTFF